MKKWVTSTALAVLAAAAVSYGVSMANQSNTWSPTTGQVSGLQITQAYNNAFSAIQSCNSGAGAPTNDQTGASVQGQCWLNTGVTPSAKQRFDGTQWVTEGWIDSTNHLWIGNNAAGLGASIASAASTDLCSGGRFNPVVVVTGTAPVTSFGATCLTGHIKYLTFQSAGLVLSHNSLSLILPNGGLNITTNAGDTAAAIALGGGNWRVVSYQSSTSPGGMPPGTEVAFAGVTPPSGWLLEAGQAISRTTNANLFAAITAATTGQPANLSTTIGSVGTDLRNQGVEGAFIEGANIPTGTTISSVTATTIVISQNATGGTPGQALTILPWGQGDGSTTANVPDRRGVVLAGRDNMGGTAANRLTLARPGGILGTKLGNAVAGGNIAGEEAHTQLLTELVSHAHTDAGHFHVFQQAASSGNQKPASAGTAPFDSNGSANTTTGFANIQNTGGGLAENNVMPTGITNWIIKQ